MKQPPRNKWYTAHVYYTFGVKGPYGHTEHKLLSKRAAQCLVSRFLANIFVDRIEVIGVKSGKAVFPIDEAALKLRKSYFSEFGDLTPEQILQFRRHLGALSTLSAKARRWYLNRQAQVQQAKSLKRPCRTINGRIVYLDKLLTNGRWQPMRQDGCEWPPLCDGYWTRTEIKEAISYYEQERAGRH